MTKRELVIEVAEKLGYTQNEVSTVVQATLDAITDCLVEGQRLEVRNFGVFEVKERDARIGRNPRTGDEVPISRKRMATFKAGKALKAAVQAPSPPGEPGGPPPAPEPAPEPRVDQEAAPAPPPVDEAVPPPAEGGQSEMPF